MGWAVGYIARDILPKIEKNKKLKFKIEMA